ncbi:SHUGOSHIN 2 isoform X2 [Hevea brasiliensis]|uniref:SHUGOSHIN 2 isoform X2 n=1 Tax=Hevea brasiliensis TaxID=3981 RepID=UPI0025D9570C|nr:SHUGOSHIN 2 isoform X2 [Hevea brasiliensis]
MGDGSKVGNMPRKTLADISNLPQQNQDKRAESVSVSTKDYINKLHQENLSLVKLLADRNKIIQTHAFQLQKLKTECQQVQQKNLQLAQSNSQMLAELNSSKDRLKVLQHELGCKNGLLKARELKSEDKANIVRCPIYGTEVETIKHDNVGQFCLADNRGNEPCNKKRRRQSKSLDPTTVKPVQLKEKIDKKRHSARFRAGKQETTDDVLEISENPIGEPVQAEKKVNNKRLCSRRQSASFKPGEQESTDDMFDINGALGSTTVTPVQTEMKVDNKRHGSRRQSARFKPGKQESTDDMFEINGALGSTTVTPVQTEMKVDNKRHGSRRQSARFKCGEQVQEPTEGLFEKDDSKFPISNLHECGPTSSFSSLKVETEEAHSDLGSEAQELQTSSVRPKRQATEKVQSYKEIPLNVKMRRPN